MRLLVLDTETSIVEGSLDGPRNSKNDIHTYIYGDHPNLIKIEHNEEGFKRELSTDLVNKINNTDLIIGLNLGFDLGFIYKTKSIQDFILRGGRIFDCQVAEYLLTGQQHTFASLAELQLKYLGVKEKENRISRLYKSGIGADKMIKARRRCPRFFKLYEKYCYSDGASTLRVFMHQWQKIKEQQIKPIVDLYNDYLLALINMSTTGIHIDIDNCYKLAHKYQGCYIDNLMKAQNCLKQTWNDERLPDFNVNSPDHKSAALFGGNIKVKVRKYIGQCKNGNDKYKIFTEVVAVPGLGAPIELTYQKSKEGLYCTDENVLNNIAKANISETLKNYCEYQKEAMMYKKANKTYIQAFLLYSENGILKPNFNNTQTSTGRLSSSKPNVQNLSKRNKFGKDLHKLLIAPEGWKAVSIDFSQLEIWVLALLSRDTLLTTHLLNGVDLHVVRLQYYNSDKSYEDLKELCINDEYWKAQRTFAKTVSYQMAYGAMPKSVAESTGLPLEIVEQIYKKEAETYPEASNLGNIVREEALKNLELVKSCDIAGINKKGKGGSRVYGKLELLPIFDIDKAVVYNSNIFRRKAVWKSPTTKKLSFLEVGRYTKDSKIKKDFSYTQPKNYPMQSTAADIQGATTFEVLLFILRNKNKIQMINEVHDSKWFYIKEDCLENVLQELKIIIEDVPSIFKQRFGIDVPFKFPVEIEVGKDFGNMDKYIFEV